jgi:hypothetical protein
MILHPFVAAVFDQRDRLARTLRALFVSSGVLRMESLPVLALIYGYDLEYRYEVAAILISWLALIVAGMVLSPYFWRVRRAEPARVSGGSSR